MMLDCSAGLSTSLLMRKMQDEAARRGLAADIAAYSATELVASSGEDQLGAFAPPMY